MPNRVRKTDATLPCDRPIWVCRTAAAAWASGPIWLAAAPRASDVWSGCRPWVRLPHASQWPMWTRNLRTSGCAGDLGLELVGRAGLDEAAPAVRAGVGQVGLVALGDLFGRRRRAVAVRAVGVARLAAGRLRVGLGRPLAERGGLPLAGAEGVVELPGQLGDLGFEFGDTLEEFPAAGTRGLVHAAIVVTGAMTGATRCPMGGYLRTKNRKAVDPCAEP